VIIPLACVSAALVVPVVTSSWRALETDPKTLRRLTGSVALMVAAWAIVVVIFAAAH